MQKKVNWIVLSLIVLSLLAFSLFAIPNSKASENIAMVSMFEPDEGIIIPVVLKMIAPKETFKQFVIHFVAYEYYFYGFPFFAPSAIALFPLQWFEQLENLPLVMLTLRQLISVLPMILATLLLVYMQDQFKTYRSVVLFLFLLLVPAVVQNGFWWHPDGLVLLFSTLVLYFLWRDNRKIGWQFFLAAISCGILIALKVVGFYFFAAVGLTLIWDLVQKKIKWQKFVWASLLFIVIMLVSLYIANPYMLLSTSSTMTYINLIVRQSSELAKGYGITYDKGVSAVWPVMHAYYGEAVFLLLVLGITIWGIWKKRTRFLHALTLAWFLPLTISLLFFTHFKYQYWLPVAIPLFSNLVIVLPENKVAWKGKHIHRIIRLALITGLSIQFILFGRQSSQLMVSRTNRAKTSPEITFYHLSVEQLQPVFPDPVYVYHDYRLYVPETEGWQTKTIFGLLSYDFIDSEQFDVLMLLEQRIRDYLNPSAVGVDPVEFEDSQAFYRDARDGTIDGYTLLFQNDTALLFIRDDVCTQYFDPSVCK
jgi:hypothetical protein